MRLSAAYWETGMSTLEAQKLREGVRLAYSKAAERPEDDHPFPVGRDFAESVGYADLLDELPAVPTNAFAGVSNLAVFADIPVGAKVLDVGSGAGLDSIIAARRTEPRGDVTGVDFSETMLEPARQGRRRLSGRVSRGGIRRSPNIAGLPQRTNQKSGRDCCRGACQEIIQTHKPG